MSKLTINKKVIPITIALICVMDILFFPYIRFLSCSFSMLLILGWSFLNIKNIFRVNVNMFVIVFLIAISHLVGYFAYDSLGEISTSIIVIYSMMLLTFLSKKGKDVPVKEILIAYLTLAFVFSLMYIVSPANYFSIRSFWTMNGEEITYIERMINRYTFFFSDPNNAACAFSGVLAYLLFFEKLKNFPLTAFCVIATVVNVVVTFSVSGVAVLCFVLFVQIFKTSVNRRFYVSTFLICIIVACGAFIIFGNKIFENNDIFKILISRITINTESGSLGGRTEIWKDVIEHAMSLKNVVIGKGSVIDAARNSYRPHSALLYLVVSYGLLACIFYISFFFDRAIYRIKKIEYLTVLVPFLAVFLINTGLSDYRFMTLFAVITCFMSNKKNSEGEQWNG